MAKARKPETTLTLVKEDEGDWQAWLGCGVARDPACEPNSLVIGYGKTRDEAAGDAVAELEALVEQLQLPAGRVTEYVRKVRRI